MKNIKQIIRHIVKEELEKFLNCREILNEGLIMSYEPRRVIRYIQEKFPLFFQDKKIGFWNRAIGTNHPVNSLNLTKPVKTTSDINMLPYVYINCPHGLKNEKKETFDEIIKIFNMSGWYFTSIINGINVYKNFTPIKNACNVNFEPKFDRHVDAVSDFVYHICPLRLVNKILKNGLQPKQGERVTNHPERLYVYNEYPSDWLSIAERFKESRKNEKYALLEINVTDIKDNIGFYYDNNLYSQEELQIYTFEPIPGKYIKVVEYEK